MSNLFQDDGRPASPGRAKVMLATTVYDTPDASYTFSIARSREALTEAGIDNAYLLLQGNCHVDDARNTVVHAFLESDCEYLVFLDADVSWRPDDLVKLCRFPMDLVGGVYPYRREDQKDRRGMPYIPLAGAEEREGLIEVAGLPTGFMKISRLVLETLAEDAERYDNQDKRIIGIPLIFERDLREGRRLGGDLHFCMKWRATGGRIYAIPDLVLGHACKTVLKDSLGAFLRRRDDKSLPRLVSRIEQGIETPADYVEAVEYVNNPWSANEEILIVCAVAARQCKGPIIETGSGLSTIVLAAANPDHLVYCLEHSEHFANQTRAMAQQCGITNIAIVHCDIANGWYALDPDDIAMLPEHFGLGLNDGPPRQLGDRTRFLDAFGYRCDRIICDDADDRDYAETLTVWAEGRDRKIHFPERRAALIMEEAA